jgi:predicted CXXCH cytochrome family protein
VQGFRPSTYTLTRHQQSRFALKGGHAAVACVECHKAPAAGTPARYHFDSLACEGCHRDPHEGRAQAKGQTCELCHTTRAWKEVETFDHSTTRFSLVGAHRAVACLECHKPSGPNRAERLIKFQETPTTCQGCHEDAHGGQFTTDCASCHNALAWKPSIFDHETRSIFSLAGAHQEVPCGDCHNQKSERRGRLVVVYKGTPIRCRECHR